jgi:1,4-dihydroxy-2-naphthoate octaprenyltransferase
MQRIALAPRYIRHMRLGFQLLLAPLFLWGLLLAGGGVDSKAAIAFLSLHLFLYPGATAFNSAYDGDVGPVSGLPDPRDVPPGLLAFSLLLQAVGALLALAVGTGFTILYFLLAAVFVAYSHPALRWKANPVASGVAVFAGQGVLGFAAGWVAAGAEIALDPLFALAALVAGATSLGLYPSTQIFQVEEDEARGDRTLAVALGRPGALGLGALCLLLAGAGAAWVATVRFGAPAAALILGGYLFMALRHALFARRLARTSPTTAEIFAWATATRLVATAFFLAFLAWLLLREIQ